MTGLLLLAAAAILAAWWLNRPARVRADCDRFWIRQMARRDYAIKLGHAAYPDGRVEVDGYFADPVWMAWYHEELDRLEDGAT